MSEQIVHQAIAWGYPCERDNVGNWLISPQKKAERWQLCQTGERWLLVVGRVPQITMTTKEVLIFLERRLR